MVRMFMYGWMFVRPRIRSDRGASLIEYVLLLAFIAVVAIAALEFLGSSVEEEVCDIGKAVAESADCTP